MDKPVLLPFEIRPGPDNDGGEVWVRVHVAGDVFEAQRWVMDMFRTTEWTAPLSGMASEPQ
jgi:hypothetical protein